ncbi:acyl-[acyl-carrier-protein] thioesterase [Lentilactobacillus kisonensis]|uniref:Acyl-ACP thioesterase n=1 Tax=Lentilactobacillus kisonensis F0435 TaxID=797516 RepID=H1LET0_9LACO|nr:acyl-ACP thioesterase domain-containing protein [Lentilactobacillus kisonensis]EHO52285.1 Acyl-ACP thioesterase [Lentilactobacillus kisonensis F0435]
MAAKEFSEYHTIPFYECDVNNQVTIPMLINILILASEHQNTELGVDQAALISKFGIGWVVISYSIKINRLPTNNATVKMTTRGTSYNRYFAYREFWLHDEQGNELVKVESVWVLMDEKKRKITPMTDEIIAPYHSEKVKRVPRLPRPEIIKNLADATAKKYQVRCSDIDFNGHVNNSHYLEWMTDALSMEFLDTHTPKQIDIRFDNEVKYGNLVTSSVVVDSQDHDRIKTVHEITSNDEISASAMFIWRQNNTKGNN